MMRVSNFLALVGNLIRPELALKGSRRFQPQRRGSATTGFSILRSGINDPAVKVDQERILESALYTFLHFHYDLVEELSRAR